MSGPVRSEEDCAEFLQGCKKQYHDARHHCYAYILGEKGEVFKCSDDGEPGHSAGDPILGQIRSMGLTNTMVVVARYFGGTKLGVSGLITAYRTSAAEALSGNNIAEIVLRDKIRIAYPYTSTNLVMRFISDMDSKIESNEYTEDCKVTILVPRNLVSKAMKQLQVLEQRSLIHSVQQYQSS